MKAEPDIRLWAKPGQLIGAVGWPNRNAFSLPAGKLSPNRGEPYPDWMLPDGSIDERLQQHRGVTR